jgi:hypothetical protein
MYSAPTTAKKCTCWPPLGWCTPDDLLWPGDADKSAGQDARAAIDFASLPKPRLSTPEWVADVERAERLGPQSIEWPSLGIPDWLEEMRQRENTSGAALPCEAASRPISAIAANLDPASSSSAPLADGPPEALYQRARAAFHAWADLEANKALIVAGDCDAIREDAAVQVILRLAEQCGPHFAHRFWKHLEFVVSTRRKYYLAAP